MGNGDASEVLLCHLDMRARWHWIPVGVTQPGEAVIEWLRLSNCCSRVLTYQHLGSKTTEIKLASSSHCRYGVYEGTPKGKIFFSLHDSQAPIRLFCSSFIVTGPRARVLICQDIAFTPFLDGKDPLKFGHDYHLVELWPSPTAVEGELTGYRDLLDRPPKSWDLQIKATRLGNYCE